MKAKAKGLTPIVREAATRAYQVLVKAARGHDPRDSHVPGLKIGTLCADVWAPVDGLPSMAAHSPPEKSPSQPTIGRGLRALAEAGAVEHTCGRWRVRYGRLGPLPLPVHCMSDEELMRLARIGVAAGLVLAEDAPLVLEVVERVAREAA